ncbi:MAG: flagellar hook assembly protein FlgD [bacterium]|nr:flagellar hook assembly protein FlgD [bacterium]
MVDIAAAIATAKQTINSGSSSSVTGAQTVDENFDTFLSLLTTQLQNQDPTKPLDTNEMTQQLIQYSEVEQLLQSNKKLEALLSLSAANASLSVIGYMGKEINSAGNTTMLANGSANWGLNIPAGSENVTYVIKDANGDEVFSSEGALTAGDGSFSWDGTTSTGSTAASGNYTLTVTARDAAENPIPVNVSVRGIVDGVDMSGDIPILLVNGTRFSVDDISEIRTSS